MTENDKVIITKSKINSIVNAIHYKNNESSGYTLDQMPAKIKAIPSGSGGNGATITITTETEDFYGQEVTLTDGVDTMTASFSNEGVAVFEGVEMEGELTVSVTVEGVTTETTVEVQTHYNVELNETPKIYGVYWDATKTQQWLRTDDAIDMANPVAALNGGSGSSPFDNIYPWSEITKVNDNDAGTLVKIPKFYYKLAIIDDTISLKISKTKLDGYSTCPLCMDRGDGKGERDFGYVSRYLCSVSSYKSLTGLAPIISKRSNARSGIHELNSDVWQYDLAAHTTLQMLYLVEYANWNSQDVIGRGIVTSFNNGITDNMEYHTGTMGSARSSKSGIQYRWVENLWSYNDYWLDGNVINSYDNKLRMFNNPSEFSDTEGSTEVDVGVVFPTSKGNVKTMHTSGMDAYNWLIIPKSIASSGYGIGDYFDFTERSGQWDGITVRSTNYVDSIYAGLFAYRLCDVEGGTICQASSRLMKLP